MASLLTILGLLLDIVGAVLLAYALFFRRTRSIVNEGYIYQQDSAIEFYGAKRVYEALQDKYNARLGLVILVTGFVLQIVAQFIQRGAVSLPVWLIALVIPLLLVGSGIYLHMKHKKDTINAAVELADRICCRTPNCTVNNLDSTIVWNSIVIVRDGVASQDHEFVNFILQKRRALYE
jgi:hypothetical protein